MKRKIITIDAELCNGCGLCIPNCPEGAIQMIDNKARLLSDLFCDGLGACLGHCPEGAITIEEREAEAYDESRVMENIVKAGTNTIKAHLTHLMDHGEKEYYIQAVKYLQDNGINVPTIDVKVKTPVENQTGAQYNGPIPSTLRQWPVQLHLLNPSAAFFEDADLLIAADCTPYAYPNFHQVFLKGRALAIACPKLDSEQQSYVSKLAEIFKTRNIKSVTVLMMEVPCCFGLARIVKTALQESKKEIPATQTVISLKGEIIRSDTLY